MISKICVEEDLRGKQYLVSQRGLAEKLRSAYDVAAWAKTKKSYKISL